MIGSHAIPFHTTEWQGVPATEHVGETGTSWWKTLQFGGLRIREVRYSKNYRADHWCTRGHIVYCLDGEVISELSDGRTFILKKGMSYQVSDGMSSHRSTTATGATLLIIDGQFLAPDKEPLSNPWKM